MAVSIQQIASRVGVSKVAVSLALRNNPRISAARRDEIQRVAIDMGYEPNVLARALAGGRTSTIGILWGLIGGPHSPVETAQNIAMRIQTRGFIPSVTDVSYLQAMESILSEYSKRHIDAVVLQWAEPVPMGEALIAKLKTFHAVVIVCPQKDPAPFDQVVQDRTPAMREVAEYLAKTGRSKPVILISHLPKSQAYEKALNDVGIKVSQDMVIRELPGSLDTFASVLDERIYLQQRKPDAILCNNDQEAMAVLAWVRSKGLRVPEDISVIGFNDSPICKFTIPLLGSIVREDKKMIDAVEKMLFARLKDAELPKQIETIPMRFVWRESAGVR